MGMPESLLTAVSLCADCFAVSLCSSVTLKKIDWKDALKVAAVFALIQTGLLLLGHLAGSLLAGAVHTVSDIIGCVLLLYVGGSMILEGVKGKGEEHNLNGVRNIIIGGIATSIDALAVGAAQSMGKEPAIAPPGDCSGRRHPHLSARRHPRRQDDRAQIRSHRRSGRRRGPVRNRDKFSILSNR